MAVVKSLLRSLSCIKRSDTRRKVGFADLEEIRLIGNARGTLIDNKAGRAVFRARYLGQEVKVYEAYSPQHAQFIAALAAKLPDLLPKTIELRNSWVIAEWIEGFHLTPELHNVQAKILKRVHGLTLSDLPAAGFCYWQDFLVPRFMRAVTLGGLSEKVATILDDIRVQERMPVVMHPDLSPENLLVTESGRIVIVDNELMCLGNMPNLDFCNAMRPLSAAQRNRLASSWFEKGTPSVSMLREMSIAWLIREIGSAFVMGKVERSHTMLRALENYKFEEAIQWLPMNCTEEGNVVVDV